MVGEKIRKRRQELGWSQQDLAEKCQISWQSVSNIERTNKGNYETINEICKSLGLKIDLVYDD